VSRSSWMFQSMMIMRAALWPSCSRSVC